MQIQIRARLDFCLLEIEREAVYFRNGNYISLTRQVLLTDDGWAKCYVENYKAWSKVNEKVPSLISNMCQDMDYGGESIFSRCFFSPFSIIDSDFYPDGGKLLPQPTTCHYQSFLQVQQTKIRSQKEDPEVSRTWQLVLIFLLSPTRGAQVFLLLFLPLPKEHLYHIESNLPPYMFGVIMPESKSRCKLELQKQTFSIAKTAFIFLPAFSLWLTSHRRGPCGPLFKMVTWKCTYTSFLRWPDIFIKSFIKI